ncbi:unnamed protein product [Caenorhabditis auriculariae]|uniref:Uncharacterized protein n=1 Tax=Caenorhabditis auriculariae TaxID=2777116 RepID=A0A8S1HBW2_9PELO|nr:unnamed protein product [Caenorhabditis auriculariae]
MDNAGNQSIIAPDKPEHVQIARQKGAQPLCAGEQCCSSANDEIVGEGRFKCQRPKMRTFKSAAVANAARDVRTRQKMGVAAPQTWPVKAVATDEDRKIAGMMMT